MLIEVVSLFCLIDGETAANAFHVEIPCNKFVDDLKDLIKTKKANRFHDVDADELTLWRVSIPVLENNDEQPILLDKASKKTKLSPLSKLSQIFDTDLPEATIHIIVEPPSQQKDFEVVMAADKGFVDKEIRFNWKVNEKKATLDDLWTEIFQNWSHCSEYKQSDLIIVFKGNRIVKPDTETIACDEDLRRLLRDTIQSNNTTITVGFKIASKSFAKWSFKDVCRTFGLSAADNPNEEDFVPFDDIQSAQLDAYQTAALNDLIKEVERMKKSLKLPNANEATKSFMIFLFLGAVTYLFNDDLYLTAQQNLTGARGNGSTDFSVIGRRDRFLTLGVTEVKKDDFQQGYAQNILQLETAAKSRKRRRNEDDVDGVEEEPVKTFGIVTDCEKWAFLECKLHTNGDTEIKASRLTETINYGNHTKDDVSALFKKLVWLWSQMKDEAQKYTNPTYTSKSKSKYRSISPDVKRIRSTPHPPF